MRELYEGAEAEQRPKSLADLVRTEDDHAYKEFCATCPAQNIRMQRVLGAAQRAFERCTRRSVEHALRAALRNVLAEPRPPGDLVCEYLDRELTDIEGWLDQDRASAVSRGLNIGLGLGAATGTLLLALPLLAGRPALALLGITLDCGDRWGLLGAFAAGGVGAFGAVLSVLGRLRLSADELAQRQAAGSGSGAVPGRQLARRMRHEGVYRVIVGWILAVAVYFVLSGGIVPVFEVPATTAQVCGAAGAGSAAGTGTEFWGFWCAIGFVAGFNERWAFGLLRRDTAAKGTKTN
ncbi:hypothetical protein ABZ896_04155 [Streptomyces sp. NPDC047072]|uniref:hypothetical protein n=1 Tax=Streptomyces sp. NPDC047072 TaxID=3154809 RepID=UPI00340F1AED